MGWQAGLACFERTMNVYPNILDHPKYLALEARLGECAMKYLIRLWAHCQTVSRGQDLGKMTPDVLEARLQWKGEKNLLWSALTAEIPGWTGWLVKRRNGHVIVHDWEEHNVYLISAWKNGRLGGRPVKPTGNRQKSDGSRSETDREPCVNPLKPESHVQSTSKNVQAKGGEGVPPPDSPEGRFAEWPTEAEWFEAARFQGLPEEAIRAEWDYQESRVPARRWANLDRTRLAHHARRVLVRWQLEQKGKKTAPPTQIPLDELRFECAEAKRAGNEPLYRRLTAELEARGA